MWVMLLWALTMPGQEVEVYKFLFFGPSAEETTEREPTNQPVLRQVGIQAFVDAKAASTLVLDLPAALHLSSVEVPRPPVCEAEGHLRPGFSLGVLFLSRLLPALQPNAP
ncbi:hypothetical protein [Rufibacter psychrotolerans]|uniref:hypothetical protein n=1 Tax=Rufibacter psychrotolerans TaxID=2812556 RepID=UPI0019681D3F|nr:hypothetical protein [Rufibacter sp. SYSU D00308]